MQELENIGLLIDTKSLQFVVGIKECGLRFSGLLVKTYGKDMLLDSTEERC